MPQSALQYTEKLCSKESDYTVIVTYATCSRDLSYQEYVI